MRFCIQRLRGPVRTFCWFWHRYEYTNWHHCTRPTGIYVHCLWWQLHLSWDRGRV